ncbi:MAG: pilus assembly FimT family protein [Phycisphaerales bacterium]
MRHHDGTRRTFVRNATARAFTLIEMLVVVAVLGIAGALIIPAMGSVGTLRVQAALRTVVSDLTFAQADAIAFQEKRALVFDTEDNSYYVAAVPGTTINEENILYNPAGPANRYRVDLKQNNFAGARISGADFGGKAWIIFDDLGAPITDLDNDTPGPGGMLTLTGSDQTYRIVVEPFTGRVTVRKTAATMPTEESGGGVITGGS